MTSSISEAEKRAKKKWRTNNPEHQYQNAKRMARTFFRRHAKPGDLEEMREIYMNENPNYKHEK